MLISLAIRDFAIIGALDVQLRAGLTVVTGETGAGKSIVLDALSLLAGARADAGVVRAGAERAELGAEFSLAESPRIRAWLREHELDGDDGAQLHVRRVVRSEGTSKAWINGRAVAISQLRELMDQLIEVHGQHDAMLLQNAALQMDVLDAFAGCEAELEQVKKLAEQVRAIDKEIAALKSLGGASTELLDLLQGQFSELSKLKLAPEHLNELDQKQRKLANAEAMIASVEHALAKLEYENNQSITRQLTHVQQDLLKHAMADKKLSEAAALLDSARIEIEEAASLIDDVRSELSLDPAALAKVEAELSKAHELARKHRVPVSLLQEKCDELEQRIASISGADQQLEKLHAQRAQTQTSWQTAAAGLSQKRKQAAKKLTKSASDMIASLGMQGGKLEFEFQPRETGEVHSNGAESGEFVVSTNPGQPLKSLRKIASGGELSRISLALKVSSLKRASVPILLFDEVDAGIGGAVATTVGSLLAQLAATHQVLLVTHLAQVAAFADQHWRVSKATDGKQTQTDLQTLNADKRVDELARMLSGTVTPSTQAAARELLAAKR
jgi:DNA repair protein RecN (Recombination protein N)